MESAAPISKPESWLPERSNRHWLLLSLLALLLATWVARQASHIAPFSSLNPTLYTAHHSSDTYRAIDPPFKPRLFAYLLVRPLVRPLPPDTPPAAPGESRFEYAGGSLSVESMRRTVWQWSFLWMMMTLVAASLMSRPVLCMLGTTAGILFAYSTQTTAPPYDLAALTFATWAVLVVVKRRHRWLTPFVVFGTGFKETIAVFATLAWAGEGSRRRRALSFTVLCALCLVLMLAIDTYSGRAWLGLQSEHVDGTAKISTNLDILLDLGPRFLLANAGLGLLIFVLPAAGRRERTFQLTAALFLLGLLLFAAIEEWRLWFELLPLNLAVLCAVLDRHASTLKKRAATWRRRFEPWPVAGRATMALLALLGLYLVAGVGLRYWYSDLSIYRLSRPAEIQESFAAHNAESLFEYHPRRQFSFRAGLSRQRPDGVRMQTDARGLVFLPPNDGSFDLLVLGSSVAVSGSLPLERSFPGLLSRATDARVFSGATPNYSLRQSVDLFEELPEASNEGTYRPWERVLYVWSPNDLTQEVFREGPHAQYIAAPPLDLLRPRELWWHVTDAFYSHPTDLTPQQASAWNPRRIPSHAKLLSRLNRDGRLIVVLTYTRLQVISGDRRPQRRLIKELERAGIPHIDPWPSYRASSFRENPDQMHLNEEGSLLFARYVVEQLVARRGTW